MSGYLVVVAVGLDVSFEFSVYFDFLQSWLIVKHYFDILSKFLKHGILFSQFFLNKRSRCFHTCCGHLFSYTLTQGQKFIEDVDFTRFECDNSAKKNKNPNNHPPTKPTDMSEVISKIPQSKTDEYQKCEGGKDVKVQHRHHSSFFAALRTAQQHQEPRYSDTHIKQMRDMRFA